MCINNHWLPRLFCIQTNATDCWFKSSNSYHSSGKHGLLFVFHSIVGDGLCRVKSACQGHRVEVLDRAKFQTDKPQETTSIVRVPRCFYMPPFPQVLFLVWHGSRLFCHVDSCDGYQHDYIWNWLKFKNGGHTSEGYFAWFKVGRSRSCAGKTHTYFFGIPALTEDQ